MPTVKRSEIIRLAWADLFFFIWFFVLAVSQFVNSTGIVLQTQANQEVRHRHGMANVVIFQNKMPSTDSPSSAMTTKQTENKPNNYVANLEIA